MIWILSGCILGGAIQLLIEAASCKKPYGVDWGRAEESVANQSTPNFGFEMRGFGDTPEQYRRVISTQWGGAVPRAGDIVEWVVDGVTESDKNFTAHGHFRSRPDPLKQSEPQRRHGANDRAA